MYRFLCQFARFGEWQKSKILESLAHWSNHFHVQIPHLLTHFKLLQALHPKMATIKSKGR